MKKILCLMLAFGCLFATACGGGTSEPGTSQDSAGKGERPTPTKVTVYIASDTIGAASQDSTVKAAIEEKFWQDTGKSIDLDVRVYGLQDFTTQMSNLMTTSRWDVAVDYLGQAGIQELMFEQNVCMDLADILDGYPTITEFIGDGFEATTDTLGTVYGIPSQNHTGDTGLMIRKDYMEAVGYTTDAGYSDDLGATTEAPNGKKKTLVTIADFQDMMQRMVDQNVCASPLIGMPWDVESLITVGPFGTANYASYARIDNPDGSFKELVPGFLSPSYMQSLSYESYWEKTGLWEADCYTKPKVNRLTDYVNGKGAVYCVDPDFVNLVKVSRQVKANNPNATFAFLNPLKGVDAEGNVVEGNGFEAKSANKECMVINKKSDKAELILEYFSWLYSDQENYELARYGVEGSHWIDSGDGYYAYPADKADQYLLDSPYMGIYAIVEQEAVWGRIYSDYTQEEKAWLEECRSAERYSCAAENMIFLGLDSDSALNRDSAGNGFFQEVTYACWTGNADPMANDMRLFNVQEAAYRNTAASYLTFLSERYKMYAAQRNINLGGKA